MCRSLQAQMYSSIYLYPPSYHSLKRSSCQTLHTFGHRPFMLLPTCSTAPYSPGCRRMKAQGLDFVVGGHVRNVGLVLLFTSRVCPCLVTDSKGVSPRPAPPRVPHPAIHLQRAKRLHHRHKHNNIALPTAIPNMCVSYRSTTHHQTQQCHHIDNIALNPPGPVLWRASSVIGTAGSVSAQKNVAASQRSCSDACFIDSGGRLIWLIQMTAAT